MSTSFFLPQSPAERVQTNIHAMVDIESLGTNPQSPIISIGAVLFDPRVQDEGQALYKRAFYRKIAIQSAVPHGKVDADTLAWWFAQDPEAIKALVGDDVVSLKDALVAFRQYCVDRYPRTDDMFFQGHAQYPQACMLWAKSPDFDAVILSHAFRATGEINPWAFWQNRCVRTIQDLAWPDGPDTRPDFHAGIGVKHDARADAVAQAMCVQAGYRQLGLSAPAQFSTF